jgi:uncharacterized protein YbjT (DUF2867 family)
MIENSKLRVVHLGATGAVGAHVLATLCQMPDVEVITVLARRKAQTQQPPKVKWQIVDVMDASRYAPLLKGHSSAICTMGVGQPSKVPREEFQRVDHDAVLAFAKACQSAGVHHFELLGSVAANPASSNFYLKSKGELRDTIANMGFSRTTTFQPSMLITPTNRYDLAQAVLLKLWPVLSTLLLGPLDKYRGVKVETLGRAMAQHLLARGMGNEILHWRDFGGG